jgi:hypothetical protein
MKKEEKKKPNLELEEKIKAAAQKEQLAEQQGTEQTEPKKRHRRTRAEIEAAEQANLNTQANPLFIPVLKMPFTVWANSVNDAKLLLSDEEAVQLATPITQLVNFYLPKVPPIAYAWTSLVLSAFAVMYPRMLYVKSLNKAKEEKKVDTGKESSPGTGAEGERKELPGETPGQAA